MILLTRPIENSKKTAAKLLKLGLKSKILPVLKIDYFHKSDLQIEKFDAVLITSKHAAKNVYKSPYLRNIPLFIVGEKVAEYFKANNSKYIFKNSDELLNLIRSNLKSGSRILYICGNFIANSLDFKLENLGYEITKEEVYKSTPTDEKTLPKDINKILFYSPKTAEIFSSKFKEQLSQIEAICISKNTANNLNKNQFKNIKVAIEPTEESIFELL